MDLYFDHPHQSDLNSIMAIEKAGFSAKEAASVQAMTERIKLINDTFLVARNPKNNQVIGYIVGPSFNQRYLNDRLYRKVIPNQKNDEYLAVLSLAVSPKFRKKGIGGQLLDEYAKVASSQNRKGITLTCLKNKILFYQRHGYKNEGTSHSSHADEIWYNMVLDL